jgi:hypothetical protein
MVQKKRTISMVSHRPEGLTNGRSDRDPYLSAALASRGLSQIEMLGALLQYSGVEILRSVENLAAAAATGSAGIPLLHPWSKASRATVSCSAAIGYARRVVAASPFRRARLSYARCTAVFAPLGSARSGTGFYGGPVRVVPQCSCNDSIRASQT